MGNSREVILLTGVTGQIGSLLFPQLARVHPDCTIYGLVRNTARLPFQNMQLGQGDITKPKLGLDDRAYRDLSRTLTKVIHCAASTSFSLSLPEARKVNVEGTANVLALAKECPRLRMFLQVSSTYVAGRAPGVLEEEPMQHHNGWFSSYEQSKAEAEQLFLNDRYGLPWAVVRLSTVVGNSRTGQSARNNYFHQLVRMIPGNRFAFIPGNGETLVDLVADDWVIAGILAILEADPSPRRFFHLCAGPGNSVPAQLILDTAYRMHQELQPGTRSVKPEFVPRERFLTLQPLSPAAMSRVEHLLMASLPHLEVNQTFANHNTNQFLSAHGLHPFETRAFLELVIEQSWRRAE